MRSSVCNDDRTPTAHETMELINEGQALKQRLREQYADQIEAALRETKLTLEGNKGGPNSVERYYYGKSVSGGSPASSSPLLSSATNTTTINALSSLTLTTGAASPTHLNGADGHSSMNAAASDTTAQSSLSPSKRDLLILQGYLPPTAAEAGSPLAPRASTTVETIRSTQRALADADERERRLKALIDQNDPIRSSLRSAQQKAIRSLIEATESSLAWEVRLAVEKADPKSPLHNNDEEAKNTQNEEDASVAENNASENANEPQVNSATAATGDQPVVAASSSSASASSSSVIMNTLHTSPVRERGSYAEERASLEKRLELLLKLEKEHEIVSKCEVATRNVYDGRRRFVEEAMDVTISREMAKAQEESRRTRGAEATEGEGVGSTISQTSADPKQKRDGSHCDDSTVAPANERKLF